MTSRYWMQKEKYSFPVRCSGELLKSFGPFSTDCYYHLLLCHSLLRLVILFIILYASCLCHLCVYPANQIPRSSEWQVRVIALRNQIGCNGAPSYLSSWAQRRIWLMHLRPPLSKCMFGLSADEERFELSTNGLTSRRSAIELFILCWPGEIRTHNLPVKSRIHLPVELRANLSEPWF